MDSGNSSNSTKDEVSPSASAVVAKPVTSAEGKVAKAAVNPTSKALVTPASSKKTLPVTKSAAVKVATKTVDNAGTKADAARSAKAKKVKMVRDSISMPKTEFQVLGELKLRADKLGVEVKKTELIRAGIKALAAMTDTSFAAAIRAVPILKPGRPSETA
jgi:hypothetical protein